MRRLAVAFVLLPMVLTGCDMTPTAAPSEHVGAPILGNVHGGQQPIVGTHVYLFAANTTGYGGTGLAATGTNASISLLKAASNTTLDTSGGATNGDYFVTTDSNGSFSITGDYTCTYGQQVYVYALGGNSGSGNNSAVGMLAILGAWPRPTSS